MDLILALCCIIPILIMFLAAVWGALLHEIASVVPTHKYKKEGDEGEFFYASMFMGQDD